MPDAYAEKLAAARQSRAMQGERRVVTLLFCDVKGSTRMAEQLDPEEWAEIMHEAFQYLVEPIYRYEGTVARLMGDAVLAFFGAPIAHEDDPQRAVLAGLDILEHIQPFCQEIQDLYDMDFSVRVGINTGPVVVGEIGADLAMEYTAMGDAANLAARMEQTAEPGTVQISEHTHRLISPLFEVEPLGAVDVKGKQEPVQAYRVVRRRRSPGRTRGIPELGSPFVGRKRELETVRGALRDLELGRGGILNLIGEAGLGKSRLIEEAKQGWLEGGEDPARWLTGRGISYDMGRPYALLQQVLRDLTGIPEGDSDAQAKEKLEAFIEALGGGDLEEVEAVFSLLLGVGEAPGIAELEGEALKRKLFSAVEHALTAVTEDEPVIVVLDDLHWGDAASVELLIHLFRLTNRDPVLFLCAFRPYRQSPGWRAKLEAETEYPHRYSEVVLAPLTEEESSELVSSLLEIADLPEKIRRVILRKAEGNPFFVEEVIRALMEDQIVVRSEDGARWVAVKPAEEIVIPDSLQALLVARIDRLAAEVRGTLQYAAVIGRSFYAKVLELAAEMEDELDDHLNILQRVELIQEVARRPEVEYVFRHELTRDAAYKTILRRQRRKFHREVGEALEELYPNRLEEFASRLAHHFERAGDDEKSLRYARMAGDAAARLFANVEAIEHYSKAIELAKKLDSPLEDLREIYLRRGRVYEHNGEFEAALAGYEELEALGESARDRHLVLAALIPQATIYSIPTAEMDHERGQPIAERALGLAEEIDDPSGQSKSLWNLMLLAHFMGEKEKAFEFGRRALSIAQEQGLEEELAYAAHDLAQVHRGQGSIERALELQQQAAAIWREMGNLPMLADSLTGTAFALLDHGEHQRAKEKAEEAAAVSASIENYWGMGYSSTILGLIYLETGHVTEAIRTLQQAEEIGERGNFIGARVIVPGVLAWIYSAFGQPERGFPLLDRAEQAAEGVEMYQSRVLAGRSWVFLKMGDIEQAKALMDRAQEWLDVDYGDVFFGPLMVFFNVDVMLGSGRTKEALEKAERNLKAMQGSGRHLVRPDLLIQIARAQRRLGQMERGAQSLQEALQVAERIGSKRAMLHALPPLIELALERHDEAEFQRLARKGDELVQYLAENIEDDALRLAFFERPETRLIRDAAQKISRP